MILGSKELESEQLISSGILGSISGDLDRAIKSFGDETYTPLTGKFRSDLTESIFWTEKFLLRGEEMLTFWEGKSFTTLSSKEQRQRIYALTAEDNKGGSGILERILKELYQDFNPGNKIGAWKEFVDAYAAFEARSEHGRWIAFFPPVLDQVEIELPNLSTRRFHGEPDTSLAINNSKLHTRFARELGIFGPQETWLDFLDGFAFGGRNLNFRTIEPDNWKEVERILQEEKDVIPAIQSGYWRLGGHEVWYEGRPYHYSAVPTKYPGITADIRFTDAVLPEDKKVDLYGLLVSGNTTIITRLNIPTEMFFPKEK